MYRLKHIPTGLYYRPRTQYTSNLSKNGKVYSGGTHGLSSFFKEAKEDENVIFFVEAYKTNRIIKETLGILEWTIINNRISSKIRAKTLVKDWIVEELS